MKKYQIFFASSALFVLANNWYVVSNSKLIPRLFDYIAYGLFIWGVYEIYKETRTKKRLNC